MTQQENQANEKEIWELYLKKCREEGTKPSIEDFKEWTKSLMNDLG